jgi:hypothetical protein
MSQKAPAGAFFILETSPSARKGCRKMSKKRPVLAGRFLGWKQIDRGSAAVWEKESIVRSTIKVPSLAPLPVW